MVQMRPREKAQLLISNTSYGSRWIFQVLPVWAKDKAGSEHIPQLPLAVFCSP